MQNAPLPARDKAEAAAIGALGWLASQEGLLPEFLSMTGASFDGLRDAAARPEFLGAVLDFILADDARVIAWCDAAGIPYSEPHASAGRFARRRPAALDLTMIHGIIFDKDGTLFDFRRSWGGWAGRLLEDISDDPATRHALGRAIGYDPGTRDFTHDSAVIAGTPEEIAALILPLLPEWAPDALIARMNALAATAAMEEAVPLGPLLARLRERGLSLGIATNDAEAPARAHLGDLATHFDFIAGSDSGFGGKPAPGQLLAFARQTGLDPSRIVMVGDSRHDLEAGRRAGMHTVAVLTGIAAEGELAPHADTVLPDIGGLPGWLDSL